MAIEGEAPLVPPFLEHAGARGRGQATLGSTSVAREQGCLGDEMSVRNSYPMTCQTVVRQLSDRAWTHTGRNCRARVVYGWKPASRGPDADRVVTTMR
jgi:hypothetical protein